MRWYDLWARVLTNLKRYDEAEKVLDEASRQPDSRVAMPVLQRTYQTLQREQERDRLIAAGREADVYLPLAKAYARNFSFTEAEEMLAKCPADTFQRADALRLRGELHFRFGRSEAATADLTEAFRLGETEAGQLLKLIRYQSAFRGTGPAEFEVGAARYTVDARSSADHVELVRLYREWELDGVALDHLEHAVRTISDDSDIRILLVELQLFYGLWHDAEPQLEWLEARRSELSTEARADLDRLQVDFRELSRPARY